MTSSDDGILARLAGIIEEIADVPAADVRPDKSFAEMEIDSLTFIEVAVAIQDEFDVDVEDDQIKDLKTVGDVVALLTKAAASV